MALEKEWQQRVEEMYWQVDAEKEEKSSLPNYEERI